MFLKSGAVPPNLHFLFMIYSSFNAFFKIFQTIIISNECSRNRSCALNNQFSFDTVGL